MKQYLVKIRQPTPLLCFAQDREGDGSLTTMFAFFVERCRDFLHICLAMYALLIYIYIERERERGGEREGEIDSSSATATSYTFASLCTPYLGLIRRI